MRVETKKPTKYIFVTGGVVSGLGKGITAASIGKLLKARGLSVNMQKCDQYLNSDAGTLNPAEHGEVFVTKDGAETDLDLGHYERFIDYEMTKASSTMQGNVYATVIENERQGHYLGKTVQIIPHITAEIQRRILNGAKDMDVHIVEVGGTVGDYESLAYTEAIRQLKHKIGAENVLFAHVVYLPYLTASKELKTKPAQNSVRDLREVGLIPDLLCVRSDHTLTDEIVQKLSMFCDVPTEAIVELTTAETVYEVPLMMEEQGSGDYIVRRLGLKKAKPKLEKWENLVKRIKGVKNEIRIGVVAKYLNHEDTYMSVTEALRSAGWYHDSAVEICWIDAEKLEGSIAPLRQVDGIVIPGGFGNRGVEGKVLAAQYARENSLPMLGICLGMQIAVIEYARNVLGLADANSTEMNPDTTHPVIDLMPDQKGVKLGGSMRLGNYDTVIAQKTRSLLAYGANKAVERHRHRFEFNNAYRSDLEKAGLCIAATSPDKKLVEMVEITEHPFYIASQFHPEFLSRPDRPHPLFRDFIGVAKRLNTKLSQRQTLVEGGYEAI